MSRQDDIESEIEDLQEELLSVKRSERTFEPEILHGPQNEKKEDAIRRANRSEALRASDLRQFHVLLGKRLDEVEGLQQALIASERKNRELREFVEASKDAQTLVVVREALDNIGTKTRKALNAIGVIPSPSITCGSGRRARCCSVTARLCLTRARVSVAALLHTVLSIRYWLSLTTDTGW